jgi:Holliday junction DNA helicase RuvA
MVARAKPGWRALWQGLEAMFAKLKGLVDSIGDDHVVIDVGGVGYLVFCASKTLGRLPPIGEAVALEIETKVSEDAIRLYGFLAPDERAWFRLLQDVQGVGAKVALNLLSVLEPDGLAQAIRAGDKAAITRAPGVGPKLAQRIALELKDKAPAPAFSVSTVSSRAQAAPAPKSVGGEALSALTNLGYRPGEAEAAIARVLSASEAMPAIGDLIRLALRELAK